MTAKLRGLVFEDTNDNTRYDTGEPGIPNVIVTLYDGTSCTTTLTDVDGFYTFDITKAGTYTIYETCETPDACPPTFCNQPKGYTCSNTKRKAKFTVLDAQIINNTVIAAFNFGHTKVESIPCEANGFQIADGSLYYINMITGKSVKKGTPGGGNALAYEPNSEKLFYIQGSSVSRINGDMSTTTLDTFFGSIIATMDEKGRMLMPSGGNVAWKMMNQESPEFLEQGVIPVSGTMSMQADWCYNPVDKKIHTGYQTIDISSGTGVITAVTYTPVVHGGVGAAFSDKDGYDYWLQNATGNIMRTILTTPTTGKAIQFSKTVPASSNDGASCIFASLSPDFGDCPDTGTLPLSKGNYRTLFEKDGPRHAYNKRLIFGAGCTQEPEALQNSDATGDSLDDGLVTPLPKLRQSALTYELDVSVTNWIGYDAYVYAWIDFNTDGVFSGNEAADPLVIPSDLNTNPRTFKLKFNILNNGTMQKGMTFLRMRLTTETLVNRNLNDLTLEDTRSYGVAEDGEVEDYSLEVGSNPVATIKKSVDKDVAEIGEEIIYTFVVSNVGDITIRDVVIKDTLPINSFLIDSPSGGQTGPSTGNTILTLTFPNLNPNESSTVTFKVKATDTVPSDILLNDGVLNFFSGDTGDTNTYGNLSNIVSTKILPLIPLEIIKYVDKKYVDLGETITYTIVMTNKNRIPSVDNIFKDTIPKYTSFVNNSFTDDGISKPGNVQVGIPVTDIPPKGVKTVTFQVRVNSSF
ncbi:MAG: SdrD B-like domain-containing protein [Clostridium sp.]|uniref:SdrD B-like domain-containing protein n=1 Tax=Clostridium sp. TaxID=1506 RepID=UPI003F38D62D